MYISQRRDIISKVFFTVKQLYSGGGHLLAKLNYLLVHADILPDVYKRVIQAKALLASGDAANASQAAKMAGISRSAYYKYKDGVFEYNPENADEMVTLFLRLKDTKGVLSAVTNELYQFGANVLSINQEVPQNGIADVLLTVRITEMTVEVNTLINKLKTVSGVKSVSLNN